MKKLILAFLIVSLSQNLFSQEWIDNIWEADWLSNFYEKNLDSANDICTVTLTSDSCYLLVVNSYSYDSATDYIYLIDEPIVYKINTEGEIVWRTYCLENNEKPSCNKNDIVDVLYDFIVLYPLTCFYVDSIYQNIKPHYFIKKIVENGLGEAACIFDKSIFDGEYKINERKIAGFKKGRYSFQTNDEGFSSTAQNNLYCEKLDEYLYSTSNYVPVFTPNGDGVNDYFGFTSFGFFRVFEVRVCNKWGKIVYQNNCMNKLWDGIYNGEIKPDIYYYFYSYELIWGKRFSMSGTLDIKIRN